MKNKKGHSKDKDADALIISYEDQENDKKSKLCTSITAILLFFVLVAIMMVVIFMVFLKPAAANQRIVFLHFSDFYHIEGWYFLK